MLACMLIMERDLAEIDPGLASFRQDNYLRINRARLEHLASLGLPIDRRRTLELGSGPGDLTGFLLERGCAVTAVDGREECLNALRIRFPQVRTLQLDLNHPAGLRAMGWFEVIHCYGLLYHLEKPEALIETIGRLCTDFAVIETCLSVGDVAGVEFADETDDYTQSLTRKGCRPTRPWMFDTLRRSFPFVYVTRTQPDHPEFPNEWDVPLDHLKNIRSVFVASQRQMPLPTLSPECLDHQERFNPGGAK
jgi:SAM-dependent methyltransferase